MKINFSEDYHKKFLSYVNSKNKESKIESDFYRKTEKYIKYIKWIPWLKMIWVWNSISMNSATKDSDIDLFIITSVNYMWLNRIIITFIFQILWVRKTSKKHAWRFCLSFFSTTTWMNFNSWKLKNDIYLYFWIVYLKPILNYDNTYETFIKQNETWADFSEYEKIIENNKKYIKFSNSIYNNNPTLNPFPFQEKGATNISSHPLELNKDNDLWIIKNINKIIKKIFLPKTIKSYKKLWKPFWVIINDNLLKFHDKDKRKEIKSNLIWKK